MVTDRHSVELARGEVAALQVKIENLTSKLRETEIEADSNNTRMKTYKVRGSPLQHLGCGIGWLR